LSSASCTKAGDSNVVPESGGVVLVVDGATRVTLACIVVGFECADHVGCNLGCSVILAAFSLGQDGESHLEQSVGWGTAVRGTCSDGLSSTPTAGGNTGSLVCVWVLETVWETNWTNILSVWDWCWNVDKSQITVHGIAVECRVLSVVIRHNHWSCTASCDWIASCVVVDINFVSSLEVHCAMSSSEDPVGADDGTTTDAT